MSRLPLTALVAALWLSAGCTAQPDCKGTAQVCAGSCVEVKSDNLNCGACGNTCGAGQVCSAGACALTCAPGLVNCGGSCVDPLTDRQHCGASGACSGGAAGTVCAAGEICSGGGCAVSCQAGLTECNGACANTQVDPLNCGQCGTTCQAGQVCSGGACRLTCQAGLVDCGGKCVDPMTDRAFCGASGACSGGAAGAVCAAGEVCSAGACAVSCQAGLTECNGACANTQVDPLNCGQCGTTCQAGQVCSGGSCRLTCQAGLVDCGGKCVDPLTDRAFCGASAACTGGTGGTVCASGEVCSGGACTPDCPAGQVACGGRCVDPLYDPDYCGAGPACTGGNGCGAGEACYQGACHALCPAGQVMCAGACIDPLTSVTHCGASGYCSGASAGVACAADHLCSAGACACPAGQVDCGGTCIDPLTDATFCGASSQCTGASAGTACGVNTHCEAGACVSNCTWQAIATHSLTTAPPGSMPAGGVDGSQGPAAVAGRTAWTTSSHWMTLLVPMGLSASDDAFAVEVDLYWPLYANTTSNAGVYALIDHAAGPGTTFYLNSYGELHGVWAGWLKGTGFTKEWHGPPTPMPSSGWRPEAILTSFSKQLSSAPAGDPTGAWHTLRVEGRRSTCAFRFLVDGSEQSSWSGACDPAGANLGLRATNPAGFRLTGIGWSNLRISRGTPDCLP